MATKSRTAVQQNHTQKLVEGNLDFSWNIYKEFIKQSDGSNVFFSPFSIALALAMTNAGAKNNTAKEIEKALKWDVFSREEDLHSAFYEILQSLNLGKDKKTLPFILHTANRMYLQESYDVVEDFKRVLNDQYLADATRVDFVTNPELVRGQINRFVEEVTKEKIKNLIPPGAINALSRLVLVNAIYFKGTWQKQFDPKATYDGDFHRSKSDVVQTKLMKLKTHFDYIDHLDLGCKALQLPYDGDRLSMVIILPNDTEGLDALENKITSDSFLNLLKSMHRRKVQVVLPKFKLEIGTSLNDILKGIGIQDLFSGSTADLTGISKSNDLFVSEVFHKGFVDVNEEGTEAAAATGVMLMTRSIGMDFEFIADHPFMFAIYDRQFELILFLGRFIGPPSPFPTQQRKEL